MTATISLEDLTALIVTLQNNPFGTLALLVLGGMAIYVLRQQRK